MVDDSKKASESIPQIDAGWDDWEEPDDASGADDRPTLAPPFDLAAFAKEKTSSAVPAAPRAPDPTTIPTPPASSAAAVIREALATSTAGHATAPFSQRKTPRESATAELAREKARTNDRPVLPPKNPTLLTLANVNVPSAPPPAEPNPAVVATKTAEPPRGARTVDDPVAEMRERFALGDYSGALVMAESLLEENPSHVDAREYAESCRAVLTQMYTARIGPLDRVPLVEVQRDQLRWLSIDHRAGFVLSLVDGVSSLEMILDVSGMRTLDAVRILYELVQQKIISFR